jgi:ABC-type branched-subunit amino acid transport system substrate-binding protein
VPLVVRRLLTLLLLLIAPTVAVAILVPRGELDAAQASAAASSAAPIPDGLPRPPPAAVGLPAIGVLLPLSGRYSPFGESCLRGIRVALGTLESGTSVLRTVVLDTRGEPSQAVSAFQKLAADPGIVAVLGPMLSPEVDAVQSYVHGYGLPTLNFSQRPVAAGGPLFRFSLTKEDQARILAEYAVGEIGARRWAAFHPNDAYGREISASFRQSVESLGGRVVADVGYDPGKNDLQAEAKRLQAKLGIVESQTPLPMPRPSPIPPVDGVFLPEAANRLGLLISYLTFVDIRGVLLLGASGWDRPQELLAVGPPLNGGVFVDGFFLYSFRPAVRAFVDAYRDAYQGDPGTLEAYGYDAAMLLGGFISAGAVSRQSMFTELRRPFSYQGATGETRITTDGRIEKGLFLLKVEDGAIHEIERSAPGAGAAPSASGSGRGEVGTLPP